MMTPKLVMIPQQGRSLLTRSPNIFNLYIMLFQ